MAESPMDIAKRNAWSEKIAQRIASQCLRWTKSGAFLDIQRSAAIIRAGVREREAARCQTCSGTGEINRRLGPMVPCGRCNGSGFQ